MPLQSLSLASQISAEGPVDPVHTTTPLEQAVLPERHSPMQLATTPPGQFWAQAMPTRGSLTVVMASSTAPLQSSSAPLRVSVPGPTIWVQVRPEGPGPGAPVQRYCAVQAPVVLAPPPVQGELMAAMSSTGP